MERKTHTIDAKGKTLGRLATRIAVLLRGKHKPSFSPDRDCGDSVVVINAGDILVTGKKAEQKFYFRHSGYPGGAKQVSYLKMLKENPCEIIRHAVKGMLPHNRLQRRMIRHLKIYPGPDQK